MNNQPTTVARNLFGHGPGGAFSLEGGVDAKLTFDSNVAADWQECLGSYDASTLAVTNNQCQGTSSFKDVYALHSLVAATSSFSNNSYFGPSGAPAKYFVINGTGLAFVAFVAFVAQVGETGAMFQSIAYADPSRDLGSYLAGLPGAPFGASPTVANFVTAIEQQSRFNWRQDMRAPVINNYLRGGFGMASVYVPYPNHD